MANINYNSATTQANAVFKYYAFAFVATSFLHIPLGVAGVAMEAPAIPMMLTMSIVQVTSWLIVANSMCLTFQTFLRTMNTPPPPRINGETKTTSMKGNSDVIEVTRRKEYN